MNESVQESGLLDEDTRSQFFNVSNLVNMTTTLSWLVCGRQTTFLDTQDKRRDFQDGRQNANQGVDLKKDEDVQDYLQDLSTSRHTSFC